MCEREREREGEKTKRDWLRVTAFTGGRTEQRHHFLSQALAFSFVSPANCRDCRGADPVQRSAKKRTCLGGEETKKNKLAKPKERGQEEEEKSERPDKSKRFVFLIFLFFSSHTPVVHLPSVFEFYERKAPRRALRLICLLCAKLQSSGKSVSFEPSSRASCSRSLLGFISFPPSGRDKVSGEGNNQQAKRRGKKGEGASEARDQAV